MVLDQLASHNIELFAAILGEQSVRTASIAMLIDNH
jgi:hypothetical protein